MREHRATRTLVKSAPELWLTCSEESLLARHLEPFGEIRVTRLEPESTVAWEGEAASGTVQIEPSGWGTRVTLTASIDEADVEQLQRPAPGPGVDSAEDAQPTVGVPASETHPAVAEAAAEVPTVAEQAESEPHSASPTPTAPPAAQSGLSEFWARFLGHLRRRPAVRPSAIAQPDVAVPPAQGAAVASAPSEDPQTTVPESDPEELRSAATDPDAAELQPAITDPDAAELQPAPGAFDADAALLAALDSLGRAHHRPFSR